MRYYFNRKSSSISVKVILEAKRKVESTLVLDTGATTTIISWKIALLLGKNPASIKRKQKIITGSGIEWCPIIYLKHVEALGKKVIKLKALCHNLPKESKIDGVLGLNFFKDLDLRINFKESFIELK